MEQIQSLQEMIDSKPAIELDVEDNQKEENEEEEQWLDEDEDLEHQQHKQHEEQHKQQNVLQNQHQNEKNVNLKARSNPKQEIIQPNSAAHPNPNNNNNNYNNNNNNSSKQKKKKKNQNMDIDWEDFFLWINGIFFFLQVFIFFLKKLKLQLTNFGNKPFDSLPTSCLWICGRDLSNLPSSVLHFI